MSSKEPVQKSLLTGTVDSFLNQKKRQQSETEGKSEGDVEFITIIEFVDRFKLLPYGLFPAQKFILKLYYGLPLDGDLKSIKITDKFNKIILHELTEKEYLAYLYDNGRCNIRVQDGRIRNELILVAGRRAGKSEISSIVCAYEIYKLICRGNPQAYYGMPASSEIRVLDIANDKDQASIVYGNMQGYIGSIDYFKSSNTHDTQSYMKFRSDGDRKKFGPEGKCIIEGSLVLTNRGLLSIESFGNPTGPEWQDINFKVAQEGKSVHEFATNFYSGGEQLVKKLVTKNGYELSATPEHRIRVLSSDGEIVWRQFNDIKIGEFIGINRSTNLWSDSYFQTSEFVNESLNKFDDSFSLKIGKFINWIGGIEGPVDMTVSEVCDLIGVASLRGVLSHLKSIGFDVRKTVKLRKFGAGSTVRWYPTKIEWDKNAGKNTKSINFPEFLDEKWGEILGILTGDGTWNYKSGIEITGGCKEFKKYLIDLFNENFSNHKIFYKKKSDNAWQIRSYSKPLRRFLERLGYVKYKPSDKRVPFVIFQSPRSVVASYLRGLFETDGTINENGLGLSFCTASHRLASEVQLLLLNFGIISNLRSKYNRKYDKYYYDLMIIGNNSYNIFKKEIRFITDRKNSRLDSIRANKNLEMIPNLNIQLRNIINNIPQRTSSKLKTRFIKLAGDAVDSKRNSGISYISLRGCIEIAREANIDDSLIKNLDHVLNTFYYWDPVKSITDDKKKVYDLCVPSGSSFVSQGMTNHNSTIVSSFKSSIAKGLRGRGVICAVLDEIAFFIDNGHSSAEKVYRALNPSLAQFSPKDPKDKHIPIGETHGRMILISSPDSKEGFFYNQYLKAMSNDPGSANMLVIQAPTWEINPTISPSYYETEFYKDPASFRTEHGAEFSDRVRGWIEDAVDLNTIIDPLLRPKFRGLPREVHFAGVDFGLSKDGTSITLTKFASGKVELVYHEIWYPRIRWRDSNPHLNDPINPYALTIHETNRLDIDQIADWFSSLSKLFYIHKGIFDQWAGPVFEQILHKKGLEQFEMRNFHTSDSSYMYQNFKMMMFNKRLSLYDWPIPDPSETGGSRHSPLIQELLELQATSAGKNMIIVEAPKVVGKHDDMSDSLARSVLLASEYIKDNPSALDVNHISGVSAYAPRIASGSHGQYHRMKARIHGVNRDRIPGMRQRVR